MDGGRKVLMIGLDACDPALAQKFAAEGVMPNLARLLKTGARAPVKNPFGLFVGALWVNFGTALKPERHGFHCWDRIDLETYRYEEVSANIAHLPTFWTQISDGGKRIAVIDVPHMIANRPVNGFQLFEWGCHDKHHGLHAQPPEMVQAVVAAHGLHPALKGDPVYEPDDNAPDDLIHREGTLRTHDEECALLRDMVAGVHGKRDVVLKLMAESEWDLFLAVFGETHSIGHQQWHLHDPRHPRHDARTLQAMGGDPLAQVYGAVDQALGEIEKQAPPDATLLVHLSHGMGPHFDGDHLLELILGRLDLHGRGEPLPPVELPVSGSAAVVRKAAKGLRKGLRLLSGAGPVPTPRWEEIRAQQRFFKEPNNTVYGGVRLNLAGREPRGIVKPEEVDALVAEITEGLLELVNVETGRPVVRAVERSERWHDRAPDDVMPDLFLDWERSALVETVSSPKIGTVHRRYAGFRTGDHRPAGMLLIRGEGFPAGARMPELAVEDIGPSIAASLGVELKDVDGVAAEWLARPGAATAAA